MPRRAIPPRLYLDRKRQVWVIRDRQHFIRTGCTDGQTVEAAEALAEYIASKHKPAPSPSPLIADVLNVYDEEHVPTVLRPEALRHHLKNLGKWWVGKYARDVNPENCRAFTKTRPGISSRRDLEALKAALNYWHKSQYGPLATQPVIVMPRKPEGRERWLTKEEAAKLLWYSRHIPYLARFIILGLRTGSRAGVLMNLEWSWIDLDHAQMRRRAPGSAESATKKKPRVRIGRKLLGHLRRWKRLDNGGKYVVHLDGHKLRDFRKAWNTARAKAGLGADVIPHTLRHTRATWLMQRGKDPWQVSGHLGMSLATLQRTYGHHSPDWQGDVVDD